MADRRDGCRPAPALQLVVHRDQQAGHVRSEPADAANGADETAAEGRAGLPLGALHRFSDLAPHVDGRPALVGPSYGNIGDKSFPSLRVAGVSKHPGDWSVPLVHAKVLVVGKIHYSDEGAMGEVGDFFVFRPKRVWLGSANLTVNSRRSLEFGIWSDDPSLVATASEFIVDLMAYSEPAESAQLHPRPELVPVEYDDAAMIEAMGDFDPDEDDYRF